jgi:hypothetical protein
MHDFVDEARYARVNIKEVSIPCGEHGFDAAGNGNSHIREVALAFQNHHVPAEVASASVSRQTSTSNSGCSQIPAPDLPCVHHLRRPATVARLALPLDASTPLNRRPACGSCSLKSRSLKCFDSSSRSGPSGKAAREKSLTSWL